MVELLQNINHWHWLALGLGLLAIELIGTAGYFLWLGVSALAVGLILAILPVSWQLQWVAFGAFSMLTTWLWWRRQLASDSQDDAQRNLNQKSKQLIGQIVVLQQDMQVGKNRIHIGDTTWSAVSDHALEKGSRVIITAVNGNQLTVAPAPNLDNLN
ncbi:NfeD family protein [Vibrio sp.]|uniref:NfeD family protein n=1 Tax=Vibrio sp. TaxID=678 RepID=UPI003D0CE6BC